MSEYTLVRRGLLSAVATDTSPVQATIAAVKTGSSFRIATIKENRRRTKIQQVSQAITDASVSPLDVTISAVDTVKTKVTITFKEKRTNDNRGVTAKLQSSTAVRLTFDTVAAGDTIDVEILVEENVDYRGATVRLVDATTVEMSWDGGALLTGETITATYEVFDVEDMGDDLKEILFRLTRLLGYAGENVRQDLLSYDDPGNMIMYRLRVFDTRANAEASTPDLPDGEDLETGELARVRMTQEILASQNDRTGMIRVLTDVADNEEVG